MRSPLHFHLTSPLILQSGALNTIIKTFKKNKHMKTKTNEQKLRAMIAENDPLINAILVERILLISELTSKEVAKNPEAFDNPIFSHGWYVKFCEQVTKHLSTKD